MQAPRLTPALRRQLVAPVKAIVFDKAGTLTELNSRWVTFFRSIIAATAADGGDPEAEHTLADCLGVGVDHIVPGSPAAVKTESELMTIALDHLVGRGWTAEQAITSMGVGLEAATFGPLAPLGAVAPTIETLAARHLLGVATSDNRANTLDELNRLGVGHHVSALRCGDDGGPVKPDPEVLLGLAREWRVEPAQLLFVGDSEQDRDTARAAGTRFIAVVPEPRGVDPAQQAPAAIGADAWITSIEDLACIEDLAG